MLLVCVVVLLGVVGIRGDEPDWGFQSYLDEDFRLTCNHSTLLPQPRDQVSWELPNGNLLEQDTEKYTLTNGVSTGADDVVGMHLTIRNVQDADAGVYVCHVYENFQMNAYRGRLLRGLNIGGPMYRDQFDKYREHLIVAVIAAVVFFVPMVTLCFVYKFRYQTKEEKQAKYAQREEAFRHQRHLESNGPGGELSNSGGAVNVGFENEERNTKL